jgi:hypothetical protein
VITRDEAFAFVLSVDKELADDLGEESLASKLSARPGALPPSVRAAVGRWTSRSDAPVAESD